MNCIKVIETEKEFVIQLNDNENHSKSKNDLEREAMEYIPYAYVV